jgi:hypothetical protein
LVADLALACQQGEYNRLQIFNQAHSRIHYTAAFGHFDIEYKNLFLQGQRSARLALNGYQLCTCSEK